MDGVFWNQSTATKSRATFFIWAQLSAGANEKAAEAALNSRKASSGQASRWGKGDAPPSRQRITHNNTATL
jgi:hypothetical protein